MKRIIEESSTGLGPSRTQISIAAALALEIFGDRLDWIPTEINSTMFLMLAVFFVIPRLSKSNESEGDLDIVEIAGEIAEVKRSLESILNSSAKSKLENQAKTSKGQHFLVRDSLDD